MTPCGIAAQDGHVGVLKLLLEGKAYVNLAMNHGATPCYIAAHNGHVDALKILLDGAMDGKDASTARLSEGCQVLPRFVCELMSDDIA